SRITLPVLLRRVAVESAFVGVVVIGTLFHEGGAVLFQFGWLRITSEGLTVLGSVSWKSLLSLLMMNLLVLTTSIPALLHGMTALKMPPLIVAIIASMYRYIGVLSEEFSSMRRAAASRNLTGSAHWQRLVVGNMFGSLFIRTYERGDRVYQAMLARGYTGLPPVHDFPSPRRMDWFALAAMICLVLAGQAAYLPR
ncbi:MAG: cobalt ECF transporter T component CbiQ, partial [Microcoleus sp. SIO2G3]|nr:cobalt ECF transporter T component CbiQ [Microcoleus sp. SIO2G3]